MVGSFHARLGFCPRIHCDVRPPRRSYFPQGSRKRSEVAQERICGDCSPERALETPLAATLADRGLVLRESKVAVNYHADQFREGHGRTPSKIARSGETKCWCSVMRNGQR